MPRVSPPNQRPWPIVVFGAPRSGTTYVTEILNSHSDVFVSNEARVFAWAFRSLEGLAGYDGTAPRHREELIQHLLSEYPDLLRAFYRRLAPAARYWGDKNPAYASNWDRGALLLSGSSSQRRDSSTSSATGAMSPRPS